MKIGPIELSWSGKASSGLSIEQVLSRFEALWRTSAGIAVTPETCMQSPTMVAIVTAISRRIATLPIQVIEKTTSGGRARKEPLPNHPVAKLLQYPNDWQDPTQFWLDAASQLVRHGNFFCQKSRGTTGPIRALNPMNPAQVEVKQGEDWQVSYLYNAGGARTVLDPSQVMHARGPARDSLRGDSTVTDIREAIALEIQAEKMGASVFGNSALPSIIFKFAEGFAGFKDDESRKAFVQGWQDVYAKSGRFSAALLPKGVEIAEASGIDNEKAQYIATRQYQRTVIAAAFGVPVHMVGDLSKGTFNNVEQQSLDFVMNVVLPYVRMFESAMERSLLTKEDRSAGRTIRFNLEAILRADFKSRQEGLNIQRQAGVISANDWRELENMNPIRPSDGGDEYWRKGPSGQDAAPPGNGSAPAPGTNDGSDNTDDATSQDATR